MSKPISFGFSTKSKTPASTPSSTSSTRPGALKPITLSTNRSSQSASSKPPTTLRDDSDNEEEDDRLPKHEALTGFSASGAILSRSVEKKFEPIIESAGNGDWRKRGNRGGKNLLPAEVRSAQSGGDLVTVEKDEASQKYGLQHSVKKTGLTSTILGDGNTEELNGQQPKQSEKEMTDDDRALHALLNDDGPQSTAIIDVHANDAWQQQRSEADDFRADMYSRPDSCTLEEYTAMPVEEFGMAMLRGMGKKRRANGEVIDLSGEARKKKEKEKKKQEGFLGVGAKPVKDLEGVELGAWGKAEMRKNARGEGFFTPLMIEDKRTGEKITEEELERRKNEAKKMVSEVDWRDRRDMNLGRNGRDKSGHVHGSEGSRKRIREEKETTSSRSRRERSRDDREDGSGYSSRSRKERSRSKERMRRDEEYDGDSRDPKRDRDRDRHRDKRRADDRYDSSTSRRSEARRRDHTSDKREGRRHDDRDRDRDRDRERW